MRNEKGLGALLLVSVVLVMVLTFIGSASVYFTSLYTQIGIQQRKIAANIVTEDFGKMIQRADEQYKINSSCGSGYTKDTTYSLCWPNATSSNPYGNCVRNPIGNSETITRWVCRTTNGTAAGGGNGTMDVVLKSVEEEENLPWTDRLKSSMVAIREKINIGLDILSTQLQDVALAQAVEQGYLPVISGAPTTGFTGSVNCAVDTDSYCNRCTSAKCVRLRICLKPDGCDAATTDPNWIKRTIALIPRS